MILKKFKYGHGAWAGILFRLLPFRLDLFANSFHREVAKNAKSEKAFGGPVLMGAVEYTKLPEVTQYKVSFFAGLASSRFWTFRASPKSGFRSFYQ